MIIKFKRAVFETQCTFTEFMFVSSFQPCIMRIPLRGRRHNKHRELVVTLLTSGTTRRRLPLIKISGACVPFRSITGYRARIMAFPRCRPAFVQYSTDELRLSTDGRRASRAAPCCIKGQANSLIASLAPLISLIISTAAAVDMERTEPSPGKSSPQTFTGVAALRGS